MVIFLNLFDNVKVDLDTNKKFDLSKLDWLIKLPAKDMYYFKDKIEEFSKALLPLFKGIPRIIVLEGPNWSGIDLVSLSVLDEVSNKFEKENIEVKVIRFGAVYDPSDTEHKLIYTEFDDDSFKEFDKESFKEFSKIDPLIIIIEDLVDFEYSDSIENSISNVQAISLIVPNASIIVEAEGDVQKMLDFSKYKLTERHWHIKVENITFSLISDSQRRKLLKHRIALSSKNQITFDDRIIEILGSNPGMHSNFKIIRELFEDVIINEAKNIDLTEILESKLYYKLYGEIENKLSLKARELLKRLIIMNYLYEGDNLVFSIQYHYKWFEQHLLNQIMMMPQSIEFKKIVKTLTIPEKFNQLIEELNKTHLIVTKQKALGRGIGSTKLISFNKYQAGLFSYFKYKQEIGLKHFIFSQYIQIDDPAKKRVPNYDVNDIETYHPHRLYCSYNELLTLIGQPIIINFNPFEIIWLVVVNDITYILYMDSSINPDLEYPKDNKMLDSWKWWVRIRSTKAHSKNINNLIEYLNEKTGKNSKQFETEAETEFLYEFKNKIEAVTYEIDANDTELQQILLATAVN